MSYLPGRHGNSCRFTTGSAVFPHPIRPRQMEIETKIAIAIAIASPILAFLGAMFGYWIFARSAKKDREHQLSMAMLPERLKAHREAYVIWWDIFVKALSTDISAPSKLELSQDIREAREWLKNNCFHLSESVNDAFDASLSAAFNHPILEEKLSKSPPSQHESAQKNCEDNLKKMREAGHTIEKAVRKLKLGVSVIRNLHEE